MANEPSPMVSSLWFLYVIFFLNKRISHWSRSSEVQAFTTMASPITYSAIDDKDFDDAALWAVIDSAAAAATSSSSSSKSRKSLALNCINKSNPSPPPKFPKSPKTPYQAQRNSRVFVEGEVVHEPWVFQPPRKIVKTCASEVSENSPLAVVCNNALRTPLLRYICLLKRTCRRRLVLVLKVLQLLVEVGWTRKGKWQGIAYLGSFLQSPSLRSIKMRQWRYFLVPFSSACSFHFSYDTFPAETKPLFEQISIEQAFVG